MSFLKKDIMRHKKGSPQKVHLHKDIGVKIICPYCNLGFMVENIESILCPQCGKLVQGNIPQKDQSNNGEAKP